MTKNNLHIFSKFKSLQIMVIGDIMIDRYITGDVSRISPEAPVPVLGFRETQDRLGGAANVALNLQALGAKVNLVSVIGNDENGAKLKQLLPKQNLDQDGVITSLDRKTTAKTRIMSQHQHLLRIDTEDTHSLHRKDTDNLVSKIKNLIRKVDFDAILLQDYNKGVLHPESITEIITLAKEHGIIITVDPKHKNFWEYKGVDLFKPNLIEISNNLPFELYPDKPYLDNANLYIQEKLNNTYTLITLSDKGLYWGGKENQKIHQTMSRDVLDVCGAGDTVISVATCGLAIGLDSDLICTLANLAGGQVCERVGVVPIDMNQLQREFSKFNQEV